jgi:hypothetical protein
LIAVFVVISVVSGGLTAYAFVTNQRRVNIFRGHSYPAIVQLIKLEKDIFGNPLATVLPDVEFELWYENEGADDELIGSYVTDKNGMIDLAEITRLGRYYFTETAVPDYYAKDVDEYGETIERYYFDVNGEREDAYVHIAAYNRRLAGSLTIDFELRYSDGSPPTEEEMDKEYGFEVVFSDDGEYPYVIYGVDGEIAGFGTIKSGEILHLKSGWLAVISDIAAKSEYSVTLVEVDGVEYDVSGSGWQGRIGDGGVLADFVITLEPPVEVTTTEVTTTEVTTTAPPTTVKPTTTVPATTVKPTTTVPATTVKPTTTVPATTVKPTTTAPATTVKPTTTVPAVGDEPDTGDDTNTIVFALIFILSTLSLLACVFSRKRYS